ncbi:uncharacterized protein LOC115928327 [Strongylocentrotus purpuratus]|uniref:Uncharacterized protein n=1 Tax=Strongylocentrotus purpuratus TaxID=7668 RepID=A0A7M7PID0_STRPU|nr:uncharacterized protein LOC115928327 [Strongylocentrotus purpuratus]
MTTLGATQVAEIITTLDEISNTVDADEIIRSIEKEAESCVEWAGYLELLMQGMSIVYAPKHDVKIDPNVLNEVASKLNDPKTEILMGLLQSEGGDHVFAIEPLGDGKARVLQGDQALRPEQSMPIDELCDTLKSLTKLDHVNDKPRLEKALCKLFGKDHARLEDKVVRRKITFISISEGIPRASLSSPAKRAMLRGLFTVIASPERARLSGSSTVSLDQFAKPCGEAVGKIIKEIKGRNITGVRMNTAFSSGLAFVMAVGGAWHSGEDVLQAGIKSALRAGVGKGVAVTVVKNTTPTITNAGASVVRANAASGIAMFGVFVVWDVVDWKMHKITSVELRQRIAEGAGAAGGGILGGAAAGAAGGVWFGGVGAGVGAVIGGLAGGIGGMFAGKGIDYMIWDQGEDAVMNSYEFFGRYDVDRSERPRMSPKKMEEAYAEKLNNKPENMEEEDWNKVCLGTFMVLAQGMYPFFQDLLKLAKKVGENHSNGLSVIATLVCERSQIKEE